MNAATTRILGLLVVTSALTWLVLWELRPPGSAPFPFYSEQPLLVLARQAAAVLAVIAALLALVLRLDSHSSVNTSIRDPLFLTQLAVAVIAGVAGWYGLTRAVALRESLGETQGSAVFSYTLPLLALALSPWLVLFATLLVAATIRTASRSVRIAAVVFDLLAMTYIAVVFRGVGYWTCMSCSGPAL